MDNKKILLVNFSKGQTGELNAKLLGMIFVMKFYAAAMSRANVPEDQREDFCLYVDEFQNFSTDSFETILSEVRKYRLNLIVGNQFMTQLTDKIREAIIGNVGTFISGRIGTTDAELVVKRFKPTFDEQDLVKLPNFQSITNVMINDAPSPPFSMNLLPPLTKNSNTQLADAVKKLSAAKYGRPRHEVEAEIAERLRPPSSVPPLGARPGGPLPAGASKSQSSGSSFLDEWLAKRKELSGQDHRVSQTLSPQKAPLSSPKAEPVTENFSPSSPLVLSESTTPPAPPVSSSQDVGSISLNKNTEDEVHIKLR
jgi:hypothetical protein